VPYPRWRELPRRWYRSLLPFALVLLASTALDQYPAADGRAFLEPHDRLRRWNVRWERGRT